jgi:transcriptional regulator with XRE-family HTH domain
VPDRKEIDMDIQGTAVIRPSGEDLGHAIRRLRRQQHATIEDLAHAADIHPTYLSGIERGIRNPTWTKLCALAHALKTPLSNLVRHTEVQAQLSSRMQSARQELGLTERYG